MPTSTPRARKSASPDQRTLTIEFSGICTLVWNREQGTADVHLVNLSASGFQRHYAALAIAIDEETPQALKGPDADAAMSMPNDNVDLGLWNLMGTTPQIIGATGKLMVDDSKVDASKKPQKDASSVRWLPDIGFLTESAALDSLAPTAATISIPAGRITASLAKSARRVEFLEDGEPVAPVRYYIPRFKAVIPFETELAIRLDAQRVLRFSASMSVVVSNTCVCGLGMSGLPNHFYAHYEVVRAKRRPKVQRPAGRAPMIVSWPELCFVGLVHS